MDAVSEIWVATLKRVALERDSNDANLHLDFLRVISATNLHQEDALAASQTNE